MYSATRLAFFVAILIGTAAPVFAQQTAASMAREQPLICFGSEPFWRLDLTETGKARFSTPDSPAVDYLGAANTLVHRKESVWRGRATVPDGGELVAFLREGACSDQMSDTVHPYSVNVSLPEGRHYAGCCRVSEALVVSASLENATWRLTGLPGQSSTGRSGAKCGYGKLRSRSRARFFRLQSVRGVVHPGRREARPRHAGWNNDGVSGTGDVG